MLRAVYILLGTLSFVLGMVGILLPVLPTTPFLLLSAACYLRGSQRMYDWLLSRPRIGGYIRQFREQRAIPLHAKVISVSMIWITLLYCAVCVAAVWWLRVLFLSLAGILTFHILSYKTLR